MSAARAIASTAPTGLRVYRGTALVASYSCLACVERACDCFDRATSALKRAGAPARLETLDGVVLAHMKSSALATRSVAMLSLAEHRTQPRALRSVGEVADEDDPLEEPTDEPGVDEDESVDDAGDDE